MSIVTNELSKQITIHAHKNEENYSLDPSTVFLIRNAVIEIIESLYECQQNKEEATKEVNNLSKFNKITLKRILRRNLGWKEYIKNGHKYLHSFQDTGKGMTIEMMGKLYKENVHVFYYGN